MFRENPKRRRKNKTKKSKKKDRKKEADVGGLNIGDHWGGILQKKKKKKKRKIKELTQSHRG